MFLQPRRHLISQAQQTGTDETVVAQSYPIGAASKTDLLAMLNDARRECETCLAISCRPTYQNSSWIPPLADDKNQGGGPLSLKETLSPVSSEIFAAGVLVHGWFYPD
jgi:LAS superfamily LD-carboxypeptidase LdcB